MADTSSPSQVDVVEIASEVSTFFVLHYVDDLLQDL